jgi:lipopolysaccharide export LptBFGC system permease protein LptF
VIFYRYVLREFLGTFLFMWALLTGLMYGVFAVGTMQQSKDLGFEFVLMNSWPLFVQVLPYTLLSGLVVGATVCYGRLAADHEIDAIRVAGIKARSALRPAFVLGLGMSAVVFYLYAVEVPRAYNRQRLTKRDLTVWLLSHPPQGPRDLTLPGARFGYLEFAEGKFKQITIVRLDPNTGKARSNVFAPEATIVFGPDQIPTIVMPQAVLSDIDAKGNRTIEVEVSDFRVPIDVDPYKNYKLRPRYRDWGQLWEGMIEGYIPLEIMKEILLRVAKGLIPLPLTLMAAGLGILVRRSSKLAGLGLSLPPLAVSMVLVVAVEGMNVRRELDAVWQAALPVAATWIGALAVVYRIRI